MIIQDLVKDKAIMTPKWLPDNTHYLTVMGSEAYGVSNRGSDIDVYGFCIPPKGVVFPHTVGVIKGFGDQGEVFDQWQQHHINYKEKEYDFQVFSIVKYFQLCMDNNPNALDSLFTYRTCVIHSTDIAEHVRNNRRLFLHKGSYHKFRGYAYSQLSKIKNKTNSSNPKRAADIIENGYDTKFAYHVVRLALQAQQILLVGDMDIMANREMLKTIRAGEWSLERLTSWFDEQEKVLENLYASSTLRHVPDEVSIKQVLVQCLEMHYGSLDFNVSKNIHQESLLTDLQNLVTKYRYGG